MQRAREAEKATEEAQANAATAAVKAQTDWDATRAKLEAELAQLRRVIEGQKEKVDATALRDLAVEPLVKQVDEKEGDKENETEVELSEALQVQYRVRSHFTAHLHFALPGHAAPASGANCDH